MINQKFIDKNIIELSKLKDNKYMNNDGKKIELNDKITITCTMCGARTFYSRDYICHKGFNFRFLCPKCMHNYRQEMMKNAPNNIGNIIKEKLENPEEKEKYLAELSKRTKEQMANLSPEEKARIAKIKSTKGKKRWSKKSKKFKKAYMQRAIQGKENMTDEDIDQWKKKLSKSRKKYYQNLDPNIRKAQIKKQKEDWDLQNESVKKEWRERTKEQWNNKSTKQRAQDLEKLRQVNIQKWQDPEYKQKMINIIRERYKNESETDKQKRIQQSSEMWEKLSDEDKYARLKITLLKSGNGDNNLNKIFEETFDNSILVNYFYYSKEILSSNIISKHWDYGIFNENADLVMVVDLDGAYFHADNCDYDGIHSKEEYDEKRTLSVPDGIKICIINELEFSKCFKKMISMLINDYSEYLDRLFLEYRHIPFPEPQYTINELIKSYQNLCKVHYNNNSYNSRLGDRLIYHFHHSIYQAHLKGKISPYDAWYDDELLRKCIENRTLYQTTINKNKIVQGFNISKIAPRISVFSAGRAKLLINKYLSEYDTIFDPFSGFSGRMLGTISLGKKYIGQDISSIHVKESNDMINFLQQFEFDVNAIIIQQDVMNSFGSYPCLFTCPPYSDKEQWLDVPVDKRSCDNWINVCLEHFKCNTYLFIVDGTDKYQDYIIDTIQNKSHFNKNNEYIIKINSK